MSPPGGRVIARVLVALDARSSRGETVPATVAIAARVGADLEALFVEDVDLLRAAALPCASEVSVPGATVRRVDRRGVEAQLAAMSAAARHAIADEARAHRLAWSFRVARGRLADELLAASRDADLLVVARLARAAASVRGRRAHAARVVARRAPASVLLLSGSGGAGRGIVVVYDSSTSARRALELAAHLSGRATPLTVLVAADTARQAEQLAERARAASPAGAALIARWAGSARIDAVIHAAARADVLLVVGAHSPVLERDGLDALLDATDAPVLLAR